ncbi:unnamed protein product [Vitrella brassicaformis CCMP3155]|uniref:U-box domain-containing protein n=1 Tax=Vitrella brassicaformis (strain CCMP3155) TaxID=1169540 RepID=A0A0G4FED0_VITBC|nr:unnamed protein product [Vitrella brassicaformis CCMP3155]|eukprot:CEM11544.1 unnamed protein product [Vitrella brassicaformis CCMP3155]
MNGPQHFPSVDDSHYEVLESIPYNELPDWIPTCSINHCIPKTPVITPRGRVYDYSAIFAYLCHYGQSPVSRRRTNPADLFPDRTCIAVLEGYAQEVKMKREAESKGDKPPLPRKRRKRIIYYDRFLRDGPFRDFIVWDVCLAAAFGLGVLLGSGVIQRWIGKRLGGVSRHTSQ